MVPPPDRYDGVTFCERLRRRAREKGCCTNVRKRRDRPGCACKAFGIRVPAIPTLIRQRSRSALRAARRRTKRAGCARRMLSTTMLRPRAQARTARCEKAHRPEKRSARSRARTREARRKLPRGASSLRFQDGRDECLHGVERYLTVDSLDDVPACDRRAPTSATLRQRTRVRIVVDRRSESETSPRARARSPRQRSRIRPDRCPRTTKPCASCAR